MGLWHPPGALWCTCSCLFPVQWALRAYLCDQSTWFSTKTWPLRLFHPPVKKGWEWLGNISEAKDDGTKVKSPKLPDSHMRRSQDDWRQLHPEGQGRALQEGRGSLNHFAGYWRTKRDEFDQELVMEMLESGVCSVESRFPKWSPWGFPGIWC